MKSLSLPSFSFPARGANSAPLLIPALLACYFVWGSTYLAIRFALQGIPPFFQMASRFLVAGTLLLGWVLWRRAQQPAGADAAWGLVVAQVCAGVLALLPLLPSVPAIQWRSAGQAQQSAAASSEAGDATSVADAACANAASLRQVARRYRDFPLLNTPHAFLGALQDAAAVAILVAYSGHAAAGFWGLALRYLKAPATLVGSAVSQALYPRLAQATPDVARQTVRQVMAVLGTLALGLMVVLMVAGPWLFQQVFGPSWREAGYLARALAPYIAAHFVAAPLAVVTMAWQAQRWALRWAIVGQIAFVMALALGLRTGGLLVGAWAVSAAMMVYFGIYFWRLACWRDIPAPQSTMGEQS